MTTPNFCQGILGGFFVRIYFCIPWLTKPRAVAITQSDMETILAGHVRKHPLPAPQRQPLGTGRHSLGSHGWDAAPAAGAGSASDPVIADCWGCAPTALVLAEVHTSSLFLAHTGLSAGSIPQNQLPLFCKTHIFKYLIT